MTNVFECAGLHRKKGSLNKMILGSFFSPRNNLVFSNFQVPIFLTKTCTGQTSTDKHSVYKAAPSSSPFLKLNNKENVFFGTRDGLKGLFRYFFPH